MKIDLFRVIALSFVLVAFNSAADQAKKSKKDFRKKFEALEEQVSSSTETDLGPALDAYAKGISALEREYPTEPEIFEALVRIASYTDGPQAEETARQVKDSPFASAQTKEQADLTLKKLKYAGKPLPLSFTAFDGREVDLAKLKGKVVLIDFWATWCPPCRAALPHLKELYQTRHDDGLEIIGMSLDEKKKDLAKFLAKEKIEWPQHFDGAAWEKSMASNFGILAIPTVWLVDKKGNVRYVAASNRLDQKVNKLLKESP